MNENDGLVLMFSIFAIAICSAVSVIAWAKARGYEVVRNVGRCGALDCPGTVESVCERHRVAARIWTTVALVVEI